MLELNWGSATDVGRIRQLNEDSYWATEGLYVVADGMGGHAAGEVASDLAVGALRQVTELEPLRAEDITTAIWRANEVILKAGAERGDRLGMGTTLAGIAVVSAAGTDHWAVFNVGDSRVYRFAGGMLSQLTVDHSEVQELVSAGQLTREEARFHPRRNVVTRSLGSEPAPAADVWVFPPEAHERFLVCSDGLTGEVDDAEIAQVLHDVTDPQEAAEELVRRANSNGGHDNVTAIVVDLISVRHSTDADQVTAPTRVQNGGMPR
ncbi:MAG TPA: PP2C family serine/threonine-protein phosphatase [Jatrophihabitans sp.]|jgi:protein phosphatase